MARATILMAVAVGLLLAITAACSDDPTTEPPEGPQIAMSVTPTAGATPVGQGPSAAASRGPSSATSVPAATVTATTAPSPVVTPRPVRYAPGEVVNVEQGVFYVDPRTGAVDAWQLPHGPTPGFFEVSSGGRYIAYSVLPPRPDAPQRWRLFDTQRNVDRDLPHGPPAFSPDERRYAIAGPDGVTVARSEDGVVERTILIARFREPQGFVPWFEWSPDSSVLLVAFDEPPWNAPAVGQVVRLVPATGDATNVADGVLPITRWSPDGRMFYAIDSRQPALRAITADGKPAWSVSLDMLGIPVPARPDKPPAIQMSLPWTSPDGQHTAVSLRGDYDTPLNRVYVLDATTGAVRYWVEGAYTCPLHAWTADSRWLLVNGMTDAESGAFLVAADGTRLRFLGPYVTDLSPVDAGIAGLRGQDGGLASLNVIGVPGGDVLQRVRFAGDIGWDTNHDPIWLADGRMVVHAPHPGHGGCGEGPPITETLRVRTP